MNDETSPQLFPNRFEGAGSGRQAVDPDTCFPPNKEAAAVEVRFHGDRQDTSSAGWQHLLALVDEAAADGREVFKPLAELSAEERRQVVTLPPTIAKLTAVKHLVLYGSNLVRVPPEIGAMTSLEEFEPYTSRRLHWYPYELTRCAKLKSSTVSTRGLYGNIKYRPQFPALRPADTTIGEVDPAIRGADTIRTCGVCDSPVAAAGLRQVWISSLVATDVLPLLVNACSAECVQALPAPDENHVREVHTGGSGIVQPPGRYWG